MLPQTMPRGFLKKILFRTARLPALYLVIGVVLIALSYIDNIFSLVPWKNLFDLTDKIGGVFIALACLTFIYNMTQFFCRWYEKRFAIKNPLVSVILASVRKGLRIIFVLVILNIIIVVMGPSTFYTQLANSIIYTIIIGFIGWMIIQALYAYESMVYQYMVKRTSRQHYKAKALYTKTRIIRNIATVVVIIMTIAIILMSFNSVRNIGISLLASAGFLTAIVGLSAQKTLVSLFSGIQIALSQTIRIGDIVVIENHSGIIEEITFTFVTLKLGDRRRLVVPISYFIEKPFENWSREGDSLRSSLHFHVDYQLPVDALRQQLSVILNHSPYWDKKASKMQVVDLAEKSVEIRIQVSAANADDLSDLKADVREKMLSFIRENYPDHLPQIGT